MELREFLIDSPKQLERGTRHIFWKASFLWILPHNRVTRIIKQTVVTKLVHYAIRELCLQLAFNFAISFGVHVFVDFCLLICLYSYMF